MSSFPWEKAPPVADELLQRFLDELARAVIPIKIIGDDIAWFAGNGTPESVITANVGSLYSRLDGGASTTLYVKESGTGNTGWVAK